MKYQNEGHPEHRKDLVDPGGPLLRGPVCSTSVGTRGLEALVDIQRTCHTSHT